MALCIITVIAHCLMFFPNPAAGLQQLNLSMSEDDATPTDAEVELAAAAVVSTYVNLNLPAVSDQIR